MNKRVQEILKLRRQGLSMDEIGKRMTPTISRQRVYQCLQQCKESGYNVPDTEKILTMKQTITKQVIQFCSKNEPHSVAEISAKTGANRDAVYHIVRKHNLPWVRSPRRPRSNYDEIKRDYEKGVSVNELAKQYGLCKSVIYYALAQQREKRQTGLKKCKVG